MDDKHDVDESQDSQSTAVSVPSIKSTTPSSRSKNTPASHGTGTNIKLAIPNIRVSSNMTDQAPKPDVAPTPDAAPAPDAAPKPNAPNPANPSGGSSSSSSRSTSTSSYTSSSTSKESPSAPQSTPKTPPKKTPLWSYPNGKPAPWRVDNSMNVKGLVRRKGDLNPLNWVLHVDNKILNHPRVGEVRTQLDLAREDEKCEGCGKRKGRENMGCLVM
ncbi:hypothetical protein CJF31_00007709 [Rutstroemia sp. NJR-2017a BVV2]|nr:hypothetical protein CJF31_00008680 [Rutstroemia sp. NJR-2017a BVV2]PQE21864.1 hypothetical protein CJF31_00007709 [Rutstroemia sp. NJR-2017a BVV2]